MLLVKALYPSSLPCFEDSFFFPRYVAGDITLAQLNETMEEVAKHLLIIIEIWGPYRYMAIW